MVVYLWGLFACLEGVLAVEWEACRACNFRSMMSAFSVGRRYICGVCSLAVNEEFMVNW